jgi:hypothetical protein
VSVQLPWCLYCQRQQHALLLLLLLLLLLCTTKQLRLKNHTQRWPVCCWF